MAGLDELGAFPKITGFINTSESIISEQWANPCLGNARCSPVNNAIP
jgi:hypothetical protein